MNAFDIISFGKGKPRDPALWTTSGFIPCDMCSKAAVGAWVDKTQLSASRPACGPRLAAVRGPVFALPA
jgi:hypothetical protein